MLSIVVHTYNSSTEETEAGESQIPGQPRLCSKTLSPKKKKREREKEKRIYMPLQRKGTPKCSAHKVVKGFPFLMPDIVAYTCSLNYLGIWSRRTV
jgi:hypothetical protein